MVRRKPTAFTAPFLKSIDLIEDRIPTPRAFPFTLPVLAAAHFRIDFTTPVTIIVGPNGSGKSTIIESLAYLCGFGRSGGSKNYAIHQQDDEILGKCLRAGWLPKVTHGFYTRAETFSDFVAQIDQFEAQDQYGGRSLTQRSHGEGYLEIFSSRIQSGGIFLFDEPEAALSPSRQLEFLKMIKTADATGGAQFIIATHSPLLMAYPGATLLHLTDTGIVERPFQQTEHFRILRDFYLDPKGFMAALFAT